MTATITIIIAAIIMTIFVFVVANNRGKLSAHNEMLKKSIKKMAEEQARANKIMDNVRNMSDDTVSDRLRKITSKQRHGV